METQYLIHLLQRFALGLAIETTYRQFQQSTMSHKKIGPVAALAKLGQHGRSRVQRPQS